MITLRIPQKCDPIRPPNHPNSIADDMRVLYCACILRGDPRLNVNAAKRTAELLGFSLPDWSWDEALAKFAENRMVNG